MSLKIKIGNYGQGLAVDYLKNKKYQIICQNYYSRFGEIDIIAKYNSQLVFVEVKTRLTNDFGIPEESVSEKKIEKLHETALFYLEENKINNDNYRFDLIALEIDKEKDKVKIRHHQCIE